jgi:tyrosyl-tRNA synthetase
MLSREAADRYKWKKPVIVSHHMLMGLEGAKQPDGMEDDKQMDMEISSKMSKSKPSTCIFMHDSKDEIAKKLASAYCPAKVIENNPVLDYAKHISFRAFSTMEIERSAKFGGSISFESYGELEKAFREGKLHPMDLKNGVAEGLDKLIEPVRNHFEKNAKAKKLYEFVKSQSVTR